jgi:Leucine-rich repeat (LRR) protein
MASQSNSVQFQPISLLNQIVSRITSGGLKIDQNSDRVRSLVNSSFLRVWLELKHSPQNFNLAYTMSNIEEYFVEEQQRNGNFPSTFSIASKNNLLAPHVNILFKKLAKKFQAERIFGSRIPVDISSYVHLQRVLEDEALQKIWDFYLLKEFVFNGPAPTSLGEIKAWLKDPANAMQLNGVQVLDAQGLELMVIPPEISALTRLQKLYLDDNEISSIPDSLSNLSQLKTLNLKDNQISSIPNSLSKLSQLQELYLDVNRISSIPDSLSNLSQLKTLNLEDNQISSIPNSLSKLSQLQELYLHDNRISSIPDSLSNLSRLKKLGLGNNLINSIPDSLSKLSRLQRLDLGDNQISSIPDSLSKLSRLKWLSFDNNQISSIPDSLGSLSQLQKLYLQNNQISSIPDSLGSLSRLKCLDFDANPLLFIYDRSTTSWHILKLVALYSKFKEYKCLSSFSNLCQLMAQKSDNHQMIKEAFGNLKKNDQNLIFEMVSKVSGIHSNEDPIFWGEHHVFDNMNIFYHAVKKAIVVKFNRLSLKEKNTVYKEIYQLAQPETEDQKWGKHHAFDDDLRLIDAMVRIGAFDHVLRLIDAMDKSEFVSDVQEFDKSLQALLSELFH